MQATELTKEQLLGLTRRELQCKAKQLGVPANRKSTEVVQAILMASGRNNARGADICEGQSQGCGLDETSEAGAMQPAGTGAEQSTSAQQPAPSASLASPDPTQTTRDEDVSEMRGSTMEASACSSVSCHIPSTGHPSMIQHDHVPAADNEWHTVSGAFELATNTQTANHAAAADAIATGSTPCLQPAMVTLQPHGPAACGADSELPSPQLFLGCHKATLRQQAAAVPVVAGTACQLSSQHQVATSTLRGGNSNQLGEEATAQQMGVPPVTAADQTPPPPRTLLNQLRRISREALLQTQPGPDMLVGGSDDSGSPSQLTPLDRTSNVTPDEAGLPFAAEQRAGLVTGRTPLRALRVSNPEAVPGYFGTTPLRTGAQVGLGGAPGSAVRSSSSGLRTPARRVPVSTDKEADQRLDAVVQAELRTKHATGWSGLVGLDYVRQQLLSTYALDTPPQAEGACAASSRSFATTTPARGIPAAASGVAVRRAPPLSTAKPAARSAFKGLHPGLTAAEPPAAATGNRYSSMAMLLYGPAGMGKTLAAKALAASMKATLLTIKRDTFMSEQHALHADQLLRAVFRVSSSLDEPSVVLLEDVDQLLRPARTEQHGMCRKLRTELLVALGELALRTKGPRIVVVGTTSCPEGVDDAVARALGRSACHMVALPDANSREMLLLGQVAACDAELGVKEMEQLVRQTEGYGCADLTMICAAAAGVAQRDMRRAPNLADFQAALGLVHKRSSQLDAVGFLKWKSHLNAIVPMQA